MRAERPQRGKLGPPLSNWPIRTDVISQLLAIIGSVATDLLHLSGGIYRT